jgi:hypothetical protein
MLNSLSLLTNIPLIVLVIYGLFMVAFPDQEWKLNEWRLKRMGLTPQKPDGYDRRITIGGIFAVVGGVILIVLLNRH